MRKATHSFASPRAMTPPQRTCTTCRTAITTASGPEKTMTGSRSMYEASMVSFVPADRFTPNTLYLIHSQHLRLPPTSWLLHFQDRRRLVLEGGSLLARELDHFYSGMNTPRARV